MNWYLVSYFRRYRLRAGLTVFGLSLALSSVFIAYGIAAWVDATSSKALAFVIRDGALWVVPKDGVVLDGKLGAIVSRGHLEAETVQAVVVAEPPPLVQRVAVGLVKMNDVPIVLYATDASSSQDLQVSPEIWRSLKGATQVVVDNRDARIWGVDPGLPASAASGSFDAWASTLDQKRRPTWLIVNSDRPRLVAARLESTIGARVSDSPDVLTSTDPGGRTLVVLLNASLSRFDPFSFQTKFSSLVLSATLSTVFGWVARSVFAIGVILAITSSLIGVREKRHEIGLFAALGHQTGITTLLLVESLALTACAFVFGAGVAVVALLGLFPGRLSSTMWGPSIVMGSIYMILLLILTPLVAAQRVASRRAIELVREGLSS